MARIDLLPEISSNINLLARSSDSTNFNTSYVQIIKESAKEYSEKKPDGYSEGQEHDILGRLRIETENFCRNVKLE